MTHTETFAHKYLEALEKLQRARETLFEVLALTHPSHNKTKGAVRIHREVMECLVDLEILTPKQ